MKKNKFKLTVLILSILLIISCGITLCWGSYEISPLGVIKTLIGQGNKLQNTAVLSIRLPRLFVGAFVAMALSTAGAVLQTITKNDLADTGIIGINAGGAVAAVLFITYSTGEYYSQLGSASIFVLPFMAIIGAGIAACLIYMMSSEKGIIKPKRLLLIGIGLNAGLNAFITFFTFRGGAGEYNRILVWTSGSLWGSSWAYAKVIMPIVAIFFILAMLNYKKLDVLSLSDETALSLGLNLQKERKKFISLAVILAGTATTFAGNIGFLGLISPHIARKLVGPYHKKLIIVSAMISVIIVLIADSVSRNLFSPIEVPVGITVAVFGVPYFIYLMMKEN
ncbi:iron complex transport system permease protein [Clostridium sp. DSM 8431]|uniref:FecCD family ABC transporter permease n=1 Tax=Clostridium sp. DSM 8431 TaxID=1761781 RepID=UPI0008EE7518|nr:iron ABC transporter permease [Clostridium sp. DSM 8431]SFU58542.1 iron complex transport system permease protein [Clostridium sp. DSM 8431]